MGSDAGGAVGGDPAGDQRHDQQEQGGGGKGEGVAGFEAVQHGLDQADEGERRTDADDDAGEGEPAGFAQGPMARIWLRTAPRARRMPISLGALGDGVGHDAVDADAREREGEHAEAGGQRGEEALLLHGRGDLLLLGADLAHGEVGVDLLDGAADDRKQGSGRQRGAGRYRWSHRPSGSWR